MIEDNLLEAKELDSFNVDAICEKLNKKMSPRIQTETKNCETDFKDIL